MEHKNNAILSFLTQTLVLFAIDILLLILFAALFGEGARNVSTMYQFGSKGLATSTILQFFLSAATISLIQRIFFSEKIFKQLLVILRTTYMLICILITHIVYILLFQWFSYDDYYAWISFLTCFVGGFVLGLLFMLLKRRLENRKYDELLSNYKKQREGDTDNE
ncbi:MAG: hypothetical protein QM644_05425 [Mobilitalea sp.]